MLRPDLTKSSLIQAHGALVVWRMLDCVIDVLWLRGSRKAGKPEQMASESVWTSDGLLRNPISKE